MSAERRLSLNTMTTKRLTLREAVEATAAAGLESIGLWRDRVAEAGVDTAAKLMHDNGLRVSSLCRGGFLTGFEEDHALADNRRAIEEAVTLGTRELVMVVGGIPDRDLAAARGRVAQRLETLVPYAVDHGVRLALEPLHPVFCADRAVISTLGQALALAAPYPAEASASSSTPSTCGGIPSWRTASPRRALSTGSARTRCATGWSRWPPTRWCRAA